MSDKKTVSQAEAEAQDEIEQIMSEIEELQQGMTEAPKGKATSGAHLKAVSQDPMEEFRGSGDEPSMEETLGEMKGESSGTGLLESDEMNQVAEAESMSKEDEYGGEGTEGALTMTLSGKMVLKLRYDFGGQEVSIGFSEDTLRVELSDGTEFKIPVGKARHLRAA